MPEILEITEAAIRNQLRQLDTISRNVANIDTRAYKREIHLHRGFDSFMAGSGAPALAAADAPDAALRSVDSATTTAPTTPETATDFRAGALRRTGSALDVAIEGDGFFQLQTAQGIVLTRDGRFQIDSQGQLTALDGAPVVTRGNAVFDGDLLIQGDGTIKTADHGEAQIEIVAAAPQALQAIGPGRYVAPTSIAPTPGSFHLRQGFVESSNVDYMQETVDMMGLMRNVQSNQQLLRAYDEIIDSAVSTLGQF